MRYFGGSFRMTDFRTVRGMRDLMGVEMRIRDYLVAKAVNVFRAYGYEPLDSPVMELWETLSAKGGEEIESETFKFTDKGEREVGLRFDLTVPLARIAATNPHLPKPFKRYAIGKAWRYDRPQAGRYREFMQADVDIIGAVSPIADAEVVMVALEFLRQVFEENYIIRINNRKVLKGLIEVAGIKEDLAFECFRAIDKLEKIGLEGVREELSNRGIKPDSGEFVLDSISLKGSGVSILDEFAELLQASVIGIEGVQELVVMAEIFEEAQLDNVTKFDLSLARGLDYYTGPVFEISYLKEPQLGSIGAGGRYDQLIEKFGGPFTPATGISLGIERIIDVIMAFKAEVGFELATDVYIAPINKSMVKFAMDFQNNLVKAGISCETDLMERPLTKLLEIADTKGVKLAIIVGPRDLEKGEVSVRDMKTKETTQVKKSNLVEYITSSCL
jgi:histidyl-tRNA synthetase